MLVMIVTFDTSADCVFLYSLFPASFLYTMLSLEDKKCFGSSLLSLQQAEFSGFQGCLRPVAHPQLAQDVAEVVLDGATGDVEGLADLTIGSPTCQQGQDLPLALSQLRQVAPAGEHRGGRSGHRRLDGGRGEGGQDF